MAKGGSGSMRIIDGVIDWYNGPEWDDVAADILEQGARDVEAQAKANAIWQDETGEARQGLTASVENRNGEVTLTLYHTAEHGLWLEVIQNGRFGIIMSTLESEGPSIINRATEQIAQARRGSS